jgi:hypothetical protein
MGMWLMDLFSIVQRDRRALKSLRAKQPVTRFDISWSAMRAAIREVRDDLANGGDFNMGLHGSSIVGLVERKLGLPYAGMIDVMRDAPDNSLWDLFYPHFEPAHFIKITPQDAVVAIENWLTNRSPWAI